MDKLKVDSAGTGLADEVFTVEDIMNGFKNTLPDEADENPRSGANRSRDGPDPRGRPKGQPSVWRELLSLFIKLAAICAAFALAFTFLYGLHRNLDPDMTPAVKDGDLVLFYRPDKDYAAGELLVLSFRGQKQVRRVVAAAGDTVDITESGFTVNGALQQELNIYEDTQRYEDGTELPVTLAEGEVFVLGDSRENATDSRVYGPVKVKDTLGTVIAVIRRRNL